MGVCNRGLALCVLYSLGSIMSSFTLKLITQLFSFRLPTIVLLIQQVCTLVVTTAMLRYQRAAPKKKQDRKPLIESLRLSLQSYVQQFQETFFLTILYILNQLSAVKGIQIISIPIYLSLRRTLIFFVFLTNCLFGDASHFNRHTMISIALISLGAILAGADDFDDNYFGYYFVISNNILTSILLQVQKMMAREDKNILEIIQGCSINGIPITIMFCVMFDEFRQLSQFETNYHCQLGVLLLIIGLIGVYYQVVQFYCNQANSPFAIAISGNFRDLVTTAISFMTFNDSRLSVSLVAGLSLSFFGAFYFSLSKMLSQSSQYKEVPRDQVLQEIESPSTLSLPKGLS